MNATPFVQLHYCPNCHGAVNIEHYTEEPDPRGRFVITLTYCESCDMGWETVYNLVDDVRVFDFFRKFDIRRNPVELGKFLQRLQDNVEIAA